MKRLTAFLTLLCLLGTLVLPVLAVEGEDPAQTTCTKTEGCILPDGHEDTCNVPCAKTPGCALQNGHEGDCFVPCTITDGCTLAADHTGDCVTQTQEPENVPSALSDSPTGLYLRFWDGDEEMVFTSIRISVGGSLNTQICFNGTPITDLSSLSYEGLNISSIAENGNFFTITPQTAGIHTISYTDTDSQTYSITVDSSEQQYNGPTLVYQTDDSRGDYRLLNIGQSFTAQIFYMGEPLRSMEDLLVDVGLEVSVDDNGYFTIRAMESGTHYIRYLDGRIQFMTPPDATNVKDGLYFLFSRDPSEGPVYINEIGLSCPGSFSAPAFLIKDGVATQVTDGSRLSCSDGGLNWFLNGANNCQIETTSGGHHVLTYTDGDGAAYHATFHVTEMGTLYARKVVNGQATGEYLSRLAVTEDEPVEVVFYYQNSASQYVRFIGQISGNDDCVQVSYNAGTGTYTVTASGFDAPGHEGSTDSYYKKFLIGNVDDYHMYRMWLDRSEAYRLALKPEGGTTVYDYILELGKSVTVDVLFGQPSSGLTAYTGTLTCSNGLTLTKTDTGYTLSAEEPGEYALTCTENGKTYTVAITAVPASSGGSLFALSGASSSPLFSTAILCGETRSLRLCYGSYGNYQTLEKEQLTLSGDSVTIENGEDGTILLTGVHFGQTLLQYTDGDGITHNYTVKCYDNSDQALFARYSSMATDATVTIPFNGNDLCVGFAIHTEDTMYMWPGNTFTVEVGDNSDEGIREELSVGAMLVESNSTVGGLADPSFYNTIQNAHISILSGTNTQNLQVGEASTVHWLNRKLEQIHVEAGSGEYFDATLLLTFDVKQGNQVGRYYRTARLSYKALPHDNVTVDITEADVLNTLLSNKYVLINYLEDTIEGYTYSGGSITLQLPAVTYDKIIVSQVLLTGSSDFMATLTLKGADGGGTVIPGLYSKGFLTYVDGITFDGSSGIPMPGLNATCGIYVNNRPTTVQPEFDLETLKKYHPDFIGITDETVLQRLYDNYNPSVPTTGNAYNVGNVTNCTFQNLDYAMYSSEGGVVTEGSYNTIQSCTYGFWLDCPVEKGYVWQVLFHDNTFIENQEAVHIGQIPDDMSPYYVRFRDNKFYENGTDFAVASPGQFYFQRNYFGGKWKTMALRTAGDGTDTARAAAIQAGSGTVLVTNPCRSQPDSITGLWIYDTDENQNTMIFQSEADAMTANPDCILELSGDLDIPILDNEENIIGVWSVAKGGGAD